jgi:hypothetical protein
MAEMWYYTTEGKQMDPVSMKELKRLVGDGTLKPTDMVWKEGMARWIRASSVKELFPDPISALDHYFSSSQEPVKKDAGPTSVTAAPGAASSPVPTSTGKSTPAAPAEDEDDAPRKKRRKSSDDDDDRDGGRPPKRRAEASGGGKGATIGIVIGIVVLVLFLVVACGGGFAIIIMLGGPGPGPQKGTPINGQTNYQVFVPPHGAESRTFTFRRGVDYELTVRSEPRHPDVDLYVIKASNNNISIADTTVGPDSRIRWTPDEDGDYRVEVRNLNNVTRVTSTVQIREVPANNPPPPPKDKVEVKDGPQPLPPGVKEGRGSVSFSPVTTTKERVQKFRVKAGHKVNISVVPTAEGPNVDFNLFVHRDSDNAVLASDDGPGASATVTFVPQATEIVRVRVVNASRGAKTSSTAKLFYDVSP